MNKGFVYYDLCAKCRRYPSSNNNDSTEVATMHVVVRFKNEVRAETSQLMLGFEDVEQHFQAGLPFGWVLEMDKFGIECHDVISEEEANKRGFIIF